MAVGTAAAISIGLSVAGAGQSFAQAARQNKLKKEAEAEAKKAVDRAKKRLEVNTFEALDLPREAYELEREAVLSAGAQATEAARESERGVAATAGRVNAAQNQQLRASRADMAENLFKLEQLKATEEGRLADMGFDLSLSEAAGAQMAARDAQMARAQAITGGFMALQDGAQTAIQAAPLYAKSQSVKARDKLYKAYMDTNPDMDFNQFLTEQGAINLAGVTDAYKINELTSGVDANVYKELLKRLNAGEFTYGNTPVVNPDPITPGGFGGSDNDYFGVGYKEG